MSKDRRVSETPATAWLRRHHVPFTEHVYDYVDHGGTAESARQLGVDEHFVVKTLVMEDDAQRPLLVLMHGDRTVSTKTLARAIGAKRVAPASRSARSVAAPFRFAKRRPAASVIKR